MANPQLPPSETFGTTVTWDTQRKAVVPLVVAMFVIITLLLAAVLDAVGLPLPLLLGAVLAAVFCAVRLQVRKTKFTNWAATTTLTAGPQGLEVPGPFRTVRLRWSDMNRIGPAPATSGYRTPGSTGRIVQRFAAAQGGTVLAVYGPTTVEVDPRGNPALRQAALDSHARQPEPHMVIGHHDGGTLDGRLGAWFRVHRPDLLG